MEALCFFSLSGGSSEIAVGHSTTPLGIYRQRGKHPNDALKMHKSRRKTPLAFRSPLKLGWKSIGIFLIPYIRSFLNFLTSALKLQSPLRTLLVHMKRKWINSTATCIHIWETVLIKLGEQPQSALFKLKDLSQKALLCESRHCQDQN